MPNSTAEAVLCHRHLSSFRPPTPLYEWLKTEIEAREVGSGLTILRDSRKQDGEAK
jgi:hypothetical protein